MSVFWQGRRVMVTGHTGFKGGWLCVWLRFLQAEVLGYALSPATAPNLFEVAHVARGLSSVIGDIRDQEHLNRTVAEFQPEIVFHLAAQPLVGEAYRAPVETYTTNIMGTVYLLEALRAVNSVRAVVNVTSDKCYENKEWVWGYRENDPMGGYDPYSSSKGCAELVTAAYRNSFFSVGHSDRPNAGIATARAGNVIGGGDWITGRLVPDVLRALLSQQPVRLRQPQSMRPWQHVLEPLAGYLMLAERLFQEPERYGEGWNFGPDAAFARPVCWVVEQMQELWGGSKPWEQEAHEPYHEAHFLKLDCAKAHSQLGWQPKLTLIEALAWVVEWTKAWHAGADMYQITESQIMDYEKRATQ